VPHPGRQQDYANAKSHRCDKLKHHIEYFQYFEAATPHTTIFVTIFINVYYKKIYIINNYNKE
jgi:hypothetical protein